MKNYIFWLIIGLAICATFGCTEKKSTVSTANYIVVNNTNDSVRLEYYSTLYRSYKGVDSVTTIVRLLRGERKTIYQRDLTNNAKSNIYDYALSDDYRGYLYGLKGNKPDTIHGQGRFYTPYSLGYPYYWKPEAVDENTVNRLLTLY